MDKGNVFDGGNIALFGPFGLLAKRKINAMILEYNDYNETNTQTIALDFWSNVRYVQPIIYDKMMSSRNKTVTPRSESTPTTPKQGGPFN